MAEAVPERVRQAVVLLKQSGDLRDKKFTRKVMDLLDGGPVDGREMLTSVLADINHEEKQVLKKVDYHAQVISAIGSPESEAFWKTHFGLQSTVPWRVFQDIFVQIEYGDLDHAGFAQLTFMLRKYLDPQGTGTVAHHRFVQFLDTKWAAVKTEFVPQRGLKLPSQRRDAEALPLIVTAVQKQTLYLREGMSFTLTQQGYPLSMRLHKDGITVFGRKSERAKSIVDVQLDDPSVSQIHAQIVFRERQFWLVDLGSTGGTYILMRKPTPVRPGFVFQLGFNDVFVVTEVNGEQLFSLDGDKEEVVDAGAWFARGGVEEVKVQMAPHVGLESSDEEKERRAIPPPLDEEGEISSVIKDEEGESEASEEEESMSLDPKKASESGESASDSASSGEYQEEEEDSEGSEEVSSSNLSQDKEEDGGGDEGGNSSDEEENPAIPEESQEESESQEQSDEEEDSQEQGSESQDASESVSERSLSRAESGTPSVKAASKQSAPQKSPSSVSASSSVQSSSQQSSSYESASSKSLPKSKSKSSASHKSASETSKASIPPQVHPNIEFLCVLKGEHLGRRWRFPADPEGVTIGKSHDCHIRLHNPQIQSKHCRFIVENGAWVVDDFGTGERVWLMLSDYVTMRRKEPSGAYLLDAGSCFKLGGVDFQVGG